MDVDLPRALIDRLLKERIDDHTLGIALTGSRARGDASAASDVDLLVVTDAPAPPPYELHYVDGWLVSTSRRSLAQRRADLVDPLQALFVVEGLRQARVLWDRDGALGALIEEARAFDWADLRTAARDAASRELAGLVEEVHKILGAFEQRDESAALYASLGITLGLAKVVGPLLELLFPTENRFFDTLYAAMGEESEWTHWHREASGFGPDPAPVMGRAAASLEAFAATADRFADDLRPEDRALVAAACTLIRSDSLPPPEGAA